MRKSKKFFLALAIMMSTGIFSASAQIYVHERPHKPEVTRGEAPSPNHVWVDEDWHAKGGHYEFAGGHYVKPPHPGYKYREGHWKHSSRGEVWVGGTWYK